MLVAEPTAFTSLKSSVYVWEVKAGGGPGRNWLGDSSTSGRILRHPRVEERRKRRRGRAPDPGRRRDIERDRREAAVIRTELDQPVRGALAVADALLLRMTIGNLGE